MSKQSKDKGLELALAAIQKSFGGGALRKGSDVEAVNTFRTGHDDLDSVLVKDGTGTGIARGKIIELFGPESAGKCLTKDTFCLTRKGLLTIDEIFEDAGTKCDNAAGFIDREYDLLNENNKFERTSHFYKNSLAKANFKTKVITTKAGFSIEGTHKHPIRVIDENGFIVWKLLAQLKVGDSVCVRRGMGVWAEKSELSDPLEGSLIGFLIGDGCVTEPTRFSLSNEDSDMVGLYKQAVKHCFGEDVEKRIRQYDNDFYTYGKDNRQKLKDKYGLNELKACDKVIPRCIRCSSKDVQAAFIRAYFDCDGTCQRDKYNLQFSSCSLELLKCLQLILLNFDIYSYITSVYKEQYDREYYELEIGGIEAFNYYKKIGFNKNNKCNPIVDYLSAYDCDKSNTNIDSIPNLNSLIRTFYNTIDPSVRSRELYDVFSDVLYGSCKVTYRRLGNILKTCDSLSGKYDKDLLSYLKRLNDEHLIFEEVVSIEDSKNRTYDFTLPETHSFWANGFISHNSSLALRVCGYAQKEGFIPYWIDLERSLVKGGIAEVNGVDMDNIYIPELVEMNLDDEDTGAPYDAGKVLDLILEVVKTGKFNPVVLDSVAGLIPEREMNAESFNSQQMMEQARLIGKAVKKISSFAAIKDVAVIFINQERDKPDMRTGVTTVTTPGGKAIKFFSSQRLRVSKKGGSPTDTQIIRVNEDGKKEIIGHIARVKIVKNRCAPPCEEDVEIPIYYKPHFPDIFERLFGFARELGVISKRNDDLTWKSGNQIVIRTSSTPSFIDSIRDQNLGAQLAYSCLQYAEMDKNKKKKSPVVLPQDVLELAKSFTPSDVVETEEEENVEELSPSPG